MTQRDVTEALDALGGEERLHRDGPGMGWRYPCPNCDSTDDALSIEIKGGRVLLYCRKCGAGLDEVSAATKVPRWVILTPGRWATPAAWAEWQEWHGRLRAFRPTTRAQVERLHQGLLASSDLRRWLVKERGLGPAIWRRYLLGYEGAALTVPVWDPERGALFVRRRGWPEPLVVRGKQVKYVTPAGATAQLYPREVSRPAASLLLGRRVVLVAGELDALLLRSRGFPAVTSTAGMLGWPDHMLDQLASAGVRGATVLFDSGEKAAAGKLAGRLAKAGIDARVVELGLRDGEDVTDWFVRYGRSADDLRQLIGRERPDGH